MAESKTWVPEGAVVRVKALEWHNFDAWTHWAEGACGTYHVEERNGYWQVELRVGGLVHGVTETDDTTPANLEAAKAAAQADYEARYLAALDLTTEPEPTSGAYEMICLTAEDVVQGRGFTGDAAVDLATAQESLRACLALLGWRG